MKHFSFHIVMCLCFVFSSCEERHAPSEHIRNKASTKTSEEIAQYFRPDNSTLIHGPIESKWNGTDVIVACYEQVYTLASSTDQQEYRRIIIHLFKDSKTPEQFLVDTIDHDGGDPTIESVFFANADQDAEKELLVIASWFHQHYDVEGISYSTFVYDNVLNDKTHTLNYLKDISTKLDGGCDCNHNDGSNDTARFKTAGDVRNELFKLGYKQ